MTIRIRALDAFIFAFWMAVLLVWTLALLPPRQPQEDPISYLATPRQVAAMGYHGILGADLKDGVWGFWRGGQRCRLYTEACLAHLKKMGL